MSPNPVEPSFNIENVPNLDKNEAIASAPVELSTKRYGLLLTQAGLNLIGYLLIGIVVGINLQFAYRFGTNLNPVTLHIVLTVLGFQLIMGVAMLTLAPEGGFAASITLKHKRWIHSILQIIGSVIAIYGCFVMSLAKIVNFDTLHGRFALASMVFTIACLFNGAASFYAYELRKCLPSNLSKLTHILFGVVAFATAAISLCYGFDKTSFRNWATHEFTDVLFVFTAIFTFICCLNPCITFFSKLNKLLN